MKPIPLYEEFRPRAWADVIGQDRAISRINALRPRGLSGRAYWISGATGTGKTTIARILASEIADPDYVQEMDAESLTPARIAALEDDLAYAAFGKGGRVVIVNESHGMRAQAIRQLLVTLERIPGHAAWIFTTTKDGQDQLFADTTDAHPLLSRCIKLELTNQGLSKPFAAKLKAGAAMIGMDGFPIEKYVRLIQDCKNNMRDAWGEIEAGTMAG